MHKSCHWNFHSRDNICRFFYTKSAVCHLRRNSYRSLCRQCNNICHSCNKHYHKIFSEFIFDFFCIHTDTHLRLFPVIFNRCDHKTSWIICRSYSNYISSGRCPKHIFFQSNGCSGSCSHSLIKTGVCLILPP